MPLTIQAASKGLVLVCDYSQWPCLCVLSHMCKTMVWKHLLTVNSKEAPLAVTAMTPHTQLKKENMGGFPDNSFPTVTTQPPKKVTA